MSLYALINHLQGERQYAAQLRDALIEEIDKDIHRLQQRKMALLEQFSARDASIQAVVGEEGVN